ncbi:MAG TPA: hypothetical protein VHM20_02705 [Gammaproteobacteria bacterium]|jgi:hypothetical protein|nr:hypothetical protein [Gammaproteobacteria bacterium]
MLERKAASTNTLRKSRLNQNEKTLFDGERSTIKKVEYCLHILQHADILTEDIRRKTIELCSEEYNRHWPFGMIESALLHLQLQNQLTIENVEAVLMHNHFDYSYYNTCSGNLVELVNLNIATPENRWIALCIEDLNYRLPEFLLFLVNKNIILDSNTCFNLEEIFRENRNILDNTIYTVKKFLDSIPKPTLEIFNEFLQTMRVETTWNSLPFRLQNESNRQAILLHCKDNSMMEFFRFLTFGGIFTQDNFNEVMCHSRYLRAFVKQLNFTDNAIKAERQFHEITRKILNAQAAECITIRQGSRTRNSFFQQLPDDLIPEISQFLIQLPDEKKTTIFNDKVDHFHENWIAKKKTMK